MAGEWSYLVKKAWQASLAVGTAHAVHGRSCMCVERQLQGELVLRKGRSQTQKVLVGHDKELELYLREP